MKGQARYGDFDCDLKVDIYIGYPNGCSEDLGNFQWELLIGRGFANDRLPLGQVVRLEHNNAPEYSRRNLVYKIAVAVALVSCTDWGGVG